MPLAISTGAPPITPIPATGRINLRRTLLVLGSVTAVAATAGFGTSPSAAETDAELVRLLQFMAVLKGVFAVLALAACYWRLARPATAWREAVYVTGPGVMAAGAICLWQLQAAGLSAVLLHLGMFALLAAALTDPTFIPALDPRRAGARR